MSVINSIEDLRGIARSRIPRALFDYIDRGSYDELTWNRNRDDLRAIQLRQRVLVDVSRLSVGTTVLGEHWNLPVGLAPTGLTGFFHRDGDDDVVIGHGHSSVGARGSNARSRAMVS
jgi:L-lactate dehydrogenase (cytochrome)